MVGGGTPFWAKLALSLAEPAGAELHRQAVGSALVARKVDFYRTGGRRREYRDHRLEWMIRSGGVDVVLTVLREDTIRFSWPG